MHQAEISSRSVGRPGSDLSGGGPPVGSVEFLLQSVVLYSPVLVLSSFYRVAFCGDP
jgi:hypothetical protein